MYGIRNRISQEEPSYTEVLFLLIIIGHIYIYIYIYIYIFTVGTYIYGVYTVLLAEILPNIRSYTVYIYGSGQPYICSRTV
jgi:hypothetical protein